MPEEKPWNYPGNSKKSAPLMCTLLSEVDLFAEAMEKAAKGEPPEIMEKI